MDQCRPRKRTQKGKRGKGKQNQGVVFCDDSSTETKENEFSSGDVYSVDLQEDILTDPHDESTFNSFLEGDVANHSLDEDIANKSFETEETSQMETSFEFDDEHEECEPESDDEIGYFIADGKKHPMIYGKHIRMSTENKFASV